MTERQAVAKAIVARAIESAREFDLSIVIGVGCRIGDDLIGATEVNGKPSVLVALYEEMKKDLPPKELKSGDR